jgi:hypothetical protein
MAVTPAYGFTVPAPYGASFVNGEQALSVASPIGSAAARTTFRLARWFDFEGGTYTIKAVADDVAFWYASVDSLNPRAVFSTQVGQGVVQSTVYLPRGRRRLDVVLSNLTTAASPCYVAFSLWKDGILVYASAPSGWVFDTALIPDSALPEIGDPRLSLRVFSVLPNWATGITERIEFLSEVMPSEADEEQRRSTRRFPRRSLEAAFARHDLTRARLDAFLTGAGRDEVLVPLWHEQYVLPATLGATLTFPADSLAMREFFAGDLVIAMNKDAGDFEVLTVESVNLGTDTITFESAPTRTWTAGCRVIPLQVGQTLEAASMQSLTDNTATVQMRFFLGWLLGDLPFSGQSRHTPHAEFRPFDAHHRQRLRHDRSHRRFVPDASGDQTVPHPAWPQQRLQIPAVHRPGSRAHDSLLDAHLEPRSHRAGWVLRRLVRREEDRARGLRALCARRSIYRRDQVQQWPSHGLPSRSRSRGGRFFRARVREPEHPTYRPVGD